MDRFINQEAKRFAEQSITEELENELKIHEREIENLETAIKSKESEADISTKQQVKKPKMSKNQEKKRAKKIETNLLLHELELWTKFSNKMKKKPN